MDHRITDVNMQKSYAAGPGSNQSEKIIKFLNLICVSLLLSANTSPNKRHTSVMKKLVNGTNSL